MIRVLIALDGLSAAELLHQRLPGCRTLVLTGLSQPGNLLRAAGSGISTEQIAARLSLSPATVRNYLSNAISKVGGRNRIDAIRIARNAGWL